MKRVALPLALALLGCAPAAKSDAVLHLRVRVPYEDGDRPIARVDVRRYETGDELETEATGAGKPFDLRKESERVIELAVRTDDPHAAASQHLLLRILFCDPNGDMPCDRDPETPELSYLISQPFYAGELTEWSAGPAGDDSEFHMPDSKVPESQAEFPRLGTPPLIINECSVAGCLEVADEPGAPFIPVEKTGYCLESSSGRRVHFCAEDS
jgi:hypothetical protein